MTAYQQPGYAPNIHGNPHNYQSYSPQYSGYPPPNQAYSAPQQGLYPKLDQPPPQQNYYGSPRSSPVVYPKSHGGQDDSGFAGFDTTKIRHGFIRKVYFILSLQMLVTVGMVGSTVFVEPVQTFLKGKAGMIIIGVGTMCYMGCVCAIFCIKKAARTTPWNYLLLILATIGLSLCVSSMSMRVDPKVVLLAAGLTFLIVLSLTIFACQTKVDFTMCSGLLLCLMIVFIGGIIAAIFIKSKLLHIVLASFGVLLFSMFLIYDTQKIVGGRKHELSPEDYVPGALMLYLDIVYIFMELLNLLSLVNND